MDSNPPGPAEAEIAPHPPVPEKLRVLALVTKSLRLYRGNFWRIAGTAVVVFVPFGFFETFVIDITEGYEDHHSGAVAGLIFAAVLLSSSFGYFGDAFYAGFLDAAVGAEAYGHERTRVSTVLRTLPYGRFVAAEIVTTLVTGALSLAFIVPGLIVNTLWCIVGPLINIERLSVRQALVRSYQLVRPAFWIAFFAVSLPVIAEEEIAHAIESLFVEHSYLDGALVNGFLAAFVWSIVGLIEVVLAYELIRRDRQRQAGRQPPPEPVGGAPG